MLFKENGQLVVKNVPYLSCPDSSEKACPGLRKMSMLFQKSGKFVVKNMIVLILLLELSFDLVSYGTKICFQMIF